MYVRSFFITVIKPQSPDHCQQITVGSLQESGQPVRLTSRFKHVGNHYESLTSIIIPILTCRNPLPLLQELGNGRVTRCFQTSCFLSMLLLLQAAPVWEITGAEFTSSNIHTAGGVSIRFPRVTRIRDDKDWTNATDLGRLKVCVCVWTSTG